MEELVGRERSFYYDHYPDKRSFLYTSKGIRPSDNGEPMTRGNATQALTLRLIRVKDAASCVCELVTILILFVQTDPVPFYFQLVENKLVLFLLSVAMTTQPLFFVGWIQGSQGKACKASFSRDFFQVVLVLQMQDFFFFCILFDILPF